MNNEVITLDGNGLDLVCGGSSGSANILQAAAMAHMVARQNCAADHRSAASGAIATLLAATASAKTDAAMRIADIRNISTLSFGGSSGLAVSLSGAAPAIGSASLAVGAGKTSKS